MVSVPILVKDIFPKLKHSLESTDFPFNIHSAVAFGSRVKGVSNESSDYDILIVAEGINPKRHRRGMDILCIKKAIKGLPLDILLLTLLEVESNFKNHNPLFLDIAEDGIIILDRDNFLKSLIEETKDYIRFKSIKRVKDGWEFPVVYRGVTSLSNVTNRDFSLAMLRDSERDYLIGKRLLDEGFYDKAVYHFQQSVEKCIKSILIAFGIFQKTHFIGEILLEKLSDMELPSEWKKRLTEAAEISEVIEPEVGLSRYPGIIKGSLWIPEHEYEKDDADEASKKSEKVLSIAKDFTAFWFGVSQ